MPSFGRSSKRSLQSAHSDLQAIAQFAIQYVDFSVLEGERGETRQNDLYSLDKTQLKWPDSKHNIGGYSGREKAWAIDVAPYPVDWQDERRFEQLSGVFQLAHRFLSEHGVVSKTLRWGGNWDQDNHLSDNKFDDLGHYELVQ